MTESEERLFRMLEQQQALTAALIANLAKFAASPAAQNIIETPVAPRIVETVQQPQPQQQPQPAPDDLPRMKIREVVEMFTQYHRGTVKESSRVAFLNILLGSTYTKEHWGDKYLDEMDWLTIQDWLDRQERHSRPLMDYVRDLKRLIDWARERRKCKTPPEFDKKFKFKRFEQRHGEELDEQTFGRLLECCRAHYTENPGAAGALIALHTGLRIGEVSGLRVGDIDLERKTLTVARTIFRLYDPLTKSTEVVVQTPKTRHSARTIPIDDEIREVLAALCEGREAEDYIVRLPRAGTLCEPRQMRCYYEQMLKREHLAHYTFHSLRHTFVSRHIRAGVNAKAVSAYVGHADLKMTLGIYTHINEDDMRHVVQN